MSGMRLIRENLDYTAWSQLFRSIVRAAITPVDLSFAGSWHIADWLMHGLVGGKYDHRIIAGAQFFADLFGQAREGQSGTKFWGSSDLSRASFQTGCGGR